MFCFILQECQSTDSNLVFKTRRIAVQRHHSCTFIGRNYPCHWQVNLHTIEKCDACLIFFALHVIVSNTSEQPGALSSNAVLMIWHWLMFFLTDCHSITDRQAIDGLKALYQTPSLPRSEIATRTALCLPSLPFFLSLAIQELSRCID